jgi:CheY-like chemotaxis protein
LKILLVDDEKMIREMSQTQLKHLGYSADIVENGQQALIALENGDYDCVITDMSMPGMSGTDLSKQIRQKYPDIDITLATGYAAEITDELRDDYGITRVLGKPYRMNDLKNLLKNIDPRDLSNGN